MLCVGRHSILRRMVKKKKKKIEYRPSYLFFFLYNLYFSSHERIRKKFEAKGISRCSENVPNEMKKSQVEFFWNTLVTFVKEIGSVFQSISPLSSMYIV